MIELSVETSSFEDVPDGQGRTVLRSEWRGGPWGIDASGNGFYDPVGPTEEGDESGWLVLDEEGNLFLHT